MLSREDIRSFLTGQKGNSKEDVLINFTSFALIHNVTIEQLGKLIMDLRSYPQWTWEE